MQIYWQHSKKKLNLDSILKKLELVLRDRQSEYSAFNKLEKKNLRKFYLKNSQHGKFQCMCSSTILQKQSGFSNRRYGIFRKTFDS
jgi:hypothetical protein